MNNVNANQTLHIVIKILITISLLVAVIYIGFCLYLYKNQRAYIYSPNRPASLNLQQMAFPFDSGNTYASVINGGKKSAIIYFGGTAEDVDFHGDIFSKLFPDKTIYLTKYRGYGNSDGTPAEQSFYEDALNIFDTLKTTHNSVAVIGRSLGTGVATYLAANRHVSKLVLVSPYDSLEAIAVKLFYLFPVRLLLHDKFDSISRASAIKSNTLVIIAKGDIIVEESHTNTLIDAFDKDIVTSVVIENHDHNSVIFSKEYYDSLRNFLN